MSLPTTFVEFKRKPCPVCGHRDRCKDSTVHPNDLVLCFRESGGSVNGFRRIKRTGECSTYIRVGSSADQGEDLVPTSRRQANLNDRAKRFSAAMPEERLQGIANELGVSAAALRALGVGWDGENPVFPEHDATNRVTAINARYPDGVKRVGHGQHRGLYIPDNLAALPDPVLLVEGASDAAACLTMDLNAVGRPNNNGGAKYLIELLRGREVIVVGENDRKSDGSWPGCDGATKVAAELSRAWGRPVPWALPPDGVKDVREYLLANRGRDPLEVGREFLARLEPATQVNEPTPDLNSHSSLISHAPSRTWPDPLDPSAFYGLAGELVRRIEPETEADPVALLINLLLGFGNAAGRNAHFIADGAWHYPNQFAVLIGETSKGRKGTAWAQAKRRLAAVDPAWAEGRVTGGLSSGEGLIWQVRDRITENRRHKPKGKPSEIVEVVTDEGVADKRLMLIESEFANVLRVLEREGNTLSPVIRQAWESGTLRALTKNSPARVQGAHVSIIGHITAEELRRYLDRSEIANGFGNRFLWACVRRSKCLPEGGNIDEEAFADLTPRIADALTFASEERRLARDGTAKRLWAEIYPELSEGKPGLAGALTGRAEAQVMRLALVYALLDCSPVIRVEHLTAGLALWEYCEASVQWCFGDATGDSVADTILESLRKAGAIGLTRTEISNLFGRHASAGRISRALATLTDRHLVTMTVEGTYGRNAERWRSA